ncbi:BREX-2 system phosphatase PglZ [Asanoa iriomotensis]|uniref:BREX-2 system phosphatase PglZ n=1 Tax=Asanoa iriomotensis TaxID=234613 RepID=UPI001EF36F15|nr:BREX-2 system phosphatase PglZ [Asanoa iriomotensis]
MQPTAVRGKVQAWLDDDDDEAPALALRSRPDWPLDDPVLRFDHATARVVECPTPLAAWAALQGRADGERLVLLTELTDGQLGEGLLAYVSRHTVRRVDPWEIVASLFAAAEIDPTLNRSPRWVVDALIERAPAAGWPPAVGTILTRDHALRSLVAEVTGIDRQQIDGAGLLQWTTDATRVLRATRYPPDLLAGLADFLADVGGAETTPIMAAARAGHGADAVPLGLLTGVLWPAPPSGARATAVAAARARLEPRFGGARLTDTQAAALHREATAWIGRAQAGEESDKHEARRMLRRAEQIAAEIDATMLLGASDVLPAGFDQRLREVAVALGLALGGPTGIDRSTASVEAALRSAEQHRGADPGRLETARMAVRLLRWLGTPDDVAPVTLHDALSRQVRVDGWVDRARLDVFAGDRDPHVAETYHLLHRAVDERRQRHDHLFAQLLADTTGGDVEPGAMLRVEDVLDRVVRPVLAAGQRVLLLVLDGMSVAAATELADSITRGGSWFELTPDGGPRVGVLAALPTVTEVSRCSLFSGHIAVGQQPAERKAFDQRFPTGVLLHKGSLRASAGAALDPEVALAVESTDTPIVAAVINTIDDALHNSQPGTTVWDTDTVHAVRDLLALATDRIVVVVSDHGHVVDRGPDGRALSGASDGNRWRSADRPVRDGELLVRGRRVALGGGQVVLPWREEIRYGHRRAGYHGGASAAEAVIPLLVFSPGDDTVVPGWAGAPVANPNWWWAAPASGVRETAPAASDPRPRSGRGAKVSLAQEGLFADPAGTPAPPSRSAPDLVADLLASEVYVQRRGARAPLPDDRVAALLRALVASSGRSRLDTLAAAAGVPAHRITGTVAALRRLLQVEGYPVLTVDPDGQTVVLDTALLAEQFGLERAR